jgi:hypothetical protein
MLPCYTRSRGTLLFKESQCGRLQRLFLLVLDHNKRVQTTDVLRHFPVRRGAGQPPRELTNPPT